MTTFQSVWDVIEDTPEEAENMEIRAELMRSIQNRIRNKDWRPKVRPQNGSE